MKHEKSAYVESASSGMAGMVAVQIAAAQHATDNLGGRISD